MTNSVRVLLDIHRRTNGLTMLRMSVAMTVAYSDANIREIRALILGPPETPYAFGFYQVRRRVNDLCVCELC